jgi:hypothetical protein
MTIGRFTIALVAGVAALAVAAPFAGAGNDTMVDDYWRDQALAARSSDTIVDDYFRDQPALASMPSNTIVDDYFRDKPALASMPSNTIVDDYFRDQQAPVSTPSNTIVDDYFRDPPTVVSSGTGFDWADFGIGVAAAVGGMLVLTGLGLGLIAARQSRGGRTHPTEAV